MMLKGIFGIVTIVFVWLTLSFATTAASGPAQNLGSNCRAFPLKVYGAGYDREMGSNDYAIFALAALNTYGPSKNYRKFTVAAYGDGWEYKGTIEDYTGLRADYYFRSGAIFDVMIAFRGTRFEEPRDWLSNFSWFYPFPTAYDSAREAFISIAEAARKRAGGRPLRFVTTGHSLGGGLAQYTAYAFPCVSAAVFDTSCVTHQSQLAQPFRPVIISLHEDKDELTGLCRFLGNSEELGSFHRYSVNYLPDGSLQHRSEGFAVGMLRAVAVCQVDLTKGTRSSCGIPATDQRAARMYCTTYGTYKGDPEACPPSRLRKSAVSIR